MRTVSFIVIFSLFSLLLPSCPQLIRAPLQKHPKHKNASKIRNRKLQSFPGSMEIANYQDTQYSATINLGSDNQAFSFALDTGSATMWIPGTYYATGSSGDYFKCSSSSTCKPFTNDSLSIEYGVGDVAGYKIQDQIQLGGLTIPQFEMLLADDTLDLSDRNFDGLIGLGSTRDPNTNLPTVIETLLQYNLISVGTFSMYLGFDPSSSGSNTGEIIFGGYDPKYAASDFQFVNVTISDDVVWWQTNVTAIGFGSSLNLTTRANSLIFDSGTSLLLLSEAIFFKFMDAASNQGVTFNYNGYYGSYMCDCSAKSTLNSLTFYFNGSTFNLSPSDYLYEEDGNCLLAISYQTGVNSVDNPMIFGDAFLSNFYALYTVDNSTVGLAIAVPVSHSSFPVWAIILIVLGSIAIIGLGICCWMKRRKKTQQQERERLIDADAGADDVAYASQAPPTQTNQDYYSANNYQNNQNYYNDNSQNNPSYQNYQNYQNNQSYQNY